MAKSSSPLLPLYVKRRKVVIANHGRHLPRRYAPSSRKGKGGIIGTATGTLTQLMKYGVPLVVALLVLQYQLPTPTRRGPSTENPAAYLCFVAATCLYWLMVGATKHHNNCTGLRKLALAFGLLSVLSLISLFLSYPASLLPLLMWTPLPLLLTWQTPYRWIMSVVIAKIQAMVVTERGGGGGGEPVLPV